jgi:hypothetical protein
LAVLPAYAYNRVNEDYQESTYWSGFYVWSKVEGNSNGYHIYEHNHYSQHGPGSDGPPPFLFCSCSRQDTDHSDGVGIDWVRTVTQGIVKDKYGNYLETITATATIYA